MKKIVTLSLLLAFAIAPREAEAKKKKSSEVVLETPSILPAEVDLTKGWKLTWNDEFDYDSDKLDDKWIFQNSKSGGMVISSRWRENAEIKDGVLHLYARKEERGGQEWTTASMWTKKQDFLYGYMEARYKFAEAPGLNNSFWMWNSHQDQYPYELDPCEGHYPNIINTNCHLWAYQGKKVNIEESRAYMGGKPQVTQPFATHTFDKPIKASKIRMRTSVPYLLSVNEFRIFAPNAAGYPTKNIRANNAETEVAGLKNLARLATTKITASGHKEVAGRVTDCSAVADGKMNTSWSTAEEIDKWLEFDFGSMQEIGNIQFTSGWMQKTKDLPMQRSNWRKVITQYDIEYFDGEKWVTAVEYDHSGGADFSKEYHSYGMYWDKEKIIYYFDGKPIRTIPFNELCEPVHSPTKLYFSLAVLSDSFAGVVTDLIDGTSMKVDYVRVYEKKK